MVPNIRPGSRTVVVGLSPAATVIDLARHGCRLTLVSGAEEVAKIRATLAEQGLRSQVMGSQQCLRSLPENLYEAVLVLDPDLGSLEDWLTRLEPGGQLVGIGPPPSGATTGPNGFWSLQRNRQ